MLLDLATDAALDLPTCTALDCTPNFWNHYLKPHLEKRVPESIAYIHTVSPSQVAIRTAHPSYAKRLKAHFASLTLLDAAEEDKYWAELEPKVKTLAKNRILALDDKLSS